MIVNWCCVTITMLVCDGGFADRNWKTIPDICHFLCAVTILKFYQVCGRPPVKHTHTHINKHTHTHTCAHTHERLRTRTHARASAHTHTRTRVCAHTHMHAHAHAHTHTHTHIYTHTHTSMTPYDKRQPAAGRHHSVAPPEWKLYTLYKLCYTVLQ